MSSEHFHKIIALILRIFHEISITISPSMQHSETQKVQVTLKVTQLANGGRETQNSPAHLATWVTFGSNKSRGHMPKT